LTHAIDEMVAKRLMIREDATANVARLVQAGSAAGLK
jgi:hypothetical protein